MPPIFNDCGLQSLAFLAIMFASYQKLNSKFAEPSAAFNRVRCYDGDISEIARGELLVKI